MSGKVYRITWRRRVSGGGEYTYYAQSEQQAWEFAAELTVKMISQLPTDKIHAGVCELLAGGYYQMAVERWRMEPYADWLEVTKLDLEQANLGLVRATAQNLLRLLPEDQRVCHES